MKKIITISLTFLFWGSVICQEGSFKDERDGRVYKTVKIGDQVWMQENLCVSTFRNGDTIPEVKTVEQWNEAAKNSQPCWCYFKNLSEKGFKYGKLYNLHAVVDERGIAPNGYHVPNYKELMQFIQIAEPFSSKNNSIRETFNSTYGGYRQGSTAEQINFNPDAFDFGYEYISEYYWINNPSWITQNETQTCMFSITSENNGEIVNYEDIYYDIMWAGCGMYVRCIKD